MQPEPFSTDQHNIIPLGRCMWREWKPAGFITAPTEEAWLEYLQGKHPKSPWKTFVVLSGNRVVGTAGIAETDSPEISKYTPWLVNEYVLPEFRGKGLARTLEESVEKEARRYGCKKLYIWVSPGSEGFHLHRGYTWLDKTGSVMLKHLS